jgi:hypothetical protein
MLQRWTLFALCLSPHVHYHYTIRKLLLVLLLPWRLLLQRLQTHATSS